MGIIKFEEWKDDPQQYQNGVNQFEITFKEWAKCENKHKKSLTDALNGAKHFYIVNNDDVITTTEKLPTFPIKEDFVKYGLKDITISEKGYGMTDFYTLICLWCIKEQGENIAKSLYESLPKGTNGREININGYDIHLGIQHSDLLQGTKKLINAYLLNDYSNYKVIFTPKSKAYNNGGKKNMSDTTDNKIEINDYIKEKIDAHKQIIFTGAPGTGKTYSVREYVKGKNDKYKEKMKSTEKKHEDIEDIYKFVQFHSSYDYTDFVEGIRPVPKGVNGENMFVRMDGTFKAFCRKIVNANIEILKDNKVLTETEINDIYYKNESKSDTKEKMKSISDSIKEKIEKEEIPMYYFVIDEINRADLSKVFGELMFGLEEDYRGVQNRFPTQYSNLPTYEIKEDKAVISEKDCFKNGFFVPENLTIIGTMNDIDRSVETFDFALRRRFAWVEIKANEVMLNSVAAINGIEDNKIDDNFNKTIENIKQMNNVISDNTYKKLGLNESYHIGPAYFKNLFDGGDIKNNLETIFKEKIEPLLREYTRGRDTKTVNDLIDNCRGKLELPKKYSGGNNG